jgi:hypothetical protein
LLLAFILEKKNCISQLFSSFEEKKTSSFSHYILESSFDQNRTVKKKNEK